MGTTMQTLVEAAREAQATAYTVRSGYAVGAAVETADGIFTGFNIEHSSYTNDLHAEEVAVATALEHGMRHITAIAVSSSARDGITPCGTCRQFLYEFAPEDLPVYCDEGDSVTEYRLGDLLPAYGRPDT